MMTCLKSIYPKQGNVRAVWAQFTFSHSVHFTKASIDIRQELELSLLRVNARPDMWTLLYGDSDLPLKVNIKIFTAVQKYIQDSNRFS